MLCRMFGVSAAVYLLFVILPTHIVILGLSRSVIALVMSGMGLAVSISCSNAVAEAPLIILLPEQLIHEGLFGITHIRGTVALSVAYCGCMCGLQKAYFCHELLCALWHELLCVLVSSLSKCRQAALPLSTPQCVAVALQIRHSAALSLHSRTC